MEGAKNTVFGVNHMNREARQSTQEQYDQILEEIKQKQRESMSSLGNTNEKLVKLLLADDDVFSNLAVKTMIEKTGKYQIFSCFNGQEVSNYLTHNRHWICIKRRKTRSQQLF